MSDQQEPSLKNKYLNHPLASLRLVAAVVCLFFSVFAIVRVPTAALWKPAIALTEFGHILVGIPVVLLIGRLQLRRSKVAFGLALFSASCCLLSAFRASSMA